MNFYVQSDSAPEACYDFLTLVRKINNGTITTTTKVRSEEDPFPLPAGVHPQLASLFLQHQQQVEYATHPTEEPLEIDFNLMNQLRSGWDFLLHHHLTAIYSAGVLITALTVAALIGAILPNFFAVLNVLVSWILALFLISFLMVIFLRMHRGQMVDITTSYEILRESFVPLFFCAALMGIFSAIGFCFLIIPGLVIIALYSFAPLLIWEHQLDFWEAMETSKRIVHEHGRPLLNILLGFAALNFFAALCFMIPLMITLPITYGAITALYEKLRLSNPEHLSDEGDFA
jgi:hypothetical protein